MKRVMNKKGQIWVETVLYTLIAFIMIGLVLAYAKPEIEKLQDKMVVDQSVKVLEEISSTILSIKGVPGNQRILEIGIKKGNLIIDCVNDKIVFELESRYEYTEQGKNVSVGNLIAYTKSMGDLNEITLTRDYEGYNLTYLGSDEIKTLTKSPTPYSVTFSNKGNINNKIEIDTNV